MIVGHDPFGIRPLYFFEENGRFGFSSEMKCLVDLSDTIEFYPPGTFSMINLNKNTHEKHTFYPMIYDPIPDNDGNIMIQTIQDKLTKAVQKRLLTDRPFGCLLSGGLDSSVITAIVCKIVGAKNVRTFAIGFKDSPDLVSAQKVADTLGTNHTNVIVTEKEMLDVKPEMDKIGIEAQLLKDQLTNMVDEDTIAFKNVMSSSRLPSTTEDEKKHKKAAKTALIVSYTY